MKLFEYRKKCIKVLFTTLSKKVNNYIYNSAVLDTDILLSFILQKNRAWILANGDVDLKVNEIEKIDKLIARRITGLPIAYITQSKEFYALDFFVDQRVLIPKSDTEVLVEKALKFCINFMETSNKNDFYILDLCAGSGCIGIAIVKNLCDKFFSIKTSKQKIKTISTKKIFINFQDISDDALNVTRINVNKLLQSEIDAKIVEVDFHCNDLRTGINGNYDCIVSNPPYVPSEITTQLLSDRRNEPRIALDGGSDGLALFKKLAEVIYSGLNTGGTFFVEAGEYNLEKATVFFNDVGFEKIDMYLDLSNSPRAFSGIKTR